MLDPATGRALAKKAAQAYADQSGLVFLTGQDVVDAWKANPPAAQAVAPPRVPTSAS